ncbi:MAG: right-handed parallel beta-helix repeat-containing protein [Euryarchaeota archaeon]|nr:right-handed parallel beta-helix repeat-containing protein [Euryarchaeota archaeon]
MLLTASLPLDVVKAHLPGDDCDVRPGMSIQSNIDASPLNARLVICAGIYAESLFINKNGLTLDAPSGAVLDGAILSGTRYGVRIANGVTGFTLLGLEIRNFDDLLRTDDPSSGIVALGASTDVRLSRVNVHDNAWTGVLFANGTGTRWTIENSTFANHRLAHVFAQDAKDVEIRNNTLIGSQHSMIVLRGKQGSISNNVVTGTGTTGILVGPSFNQAKWSQGLKIHNNTLTGNRTHGVWALGLQDGIIRDNVVNVTGAAMTLGGNPEDIVILKNAGAPIVETKETKAARKTFKNGLAPDYRLQTWDLAVISCEWFVCALGAHPVGLDNSRVRIFRAVFST